MCTTVLFSAKVEGALLPCPCTTYTKCYLVLTDGNDNHKNDVVGPQRYYCCSPLCVLGRKVLESGETPLLDVRGLCGATLTFGRYKQCHAIFTSLICYELKENMSYFPYAAMAS